VLAAAARASLQLTSLHAAQRADILLDGSKRGVIQDDLTALAKVPNHCSSAAQQSSKGWLGQRVSVQTGGGAVARS
jgi:hypothetical protein